MSCHVISRENRDGGRARPDCVLLNGDTEFTLKNLNKIPYKCQILYTNAAGKGDISDPYNATPGEGDCGTGGEEGQNRSEKRSGIRLSFSSKTSFSKLVLKEKCSTFVTCKFLYSTTRKKSKEKNLSSQMIGDILSCFFFNFEGFQAHREEPPWRTQMRKLCLFVFEVALQYLQSRTAKQLMRSLLYTGGYWI